ncbi:MAG: hypothetical protein JSS48_17940 [Nitrospira sp.]|nr:hypothetical protein [Nitrospira sp.]
MLVEQMSKYMIQVIDKCQREGYKSIQPKDEAVESFMKYTDDYFQRTVFTANCKSWYKNGQSGASKVRALWPGSSQHAFIALRNPRWEDFDYRRAEGYDHTMAWLGNGHIKEDVDMAFYYPELRAYYSVSLRRAE